MRYLKPASEDAERRWRQEMTRSEAAETRRSWLPQKGQSESAIQLLSLHSLFWMLISG